ncbi:hypothetical protein BDN72DRAFT_830815 [Pluteus cervinus]|uniref:Uncharacterized protein n=1 Tax=Pluteus cervinus TaxID=181527 RepID=A0ACD3BGX1_9AGAR|nr:hypothetical protein BDN72DRAFT_830815 [Pluteus cervinus]
MSSPHFTIFNHYPSSQFLFSAGSILFRHPPESPTGTSTPYPISSLDGTGPPTSTRSSSQQDLLGLSPPTETSTNSRDNVERAGDGHTTPSPSSDNLEICILHHRKNDLWVLPKGRKDQGETLISAALRETYEETGYACELLPCKMSTRAPAVGVDTHPNQVLIAEESVEPFSISIRPLVNRTAEMARSKKLIGDSTDPAPNIKIIFWYLARLKDGARTQRVLGTQTDSEDYEAAFLDADVAVQKLSFEQDRQVASQAVDLVRSSEQALAAIQRPLFL